MTVPISAVDAISPAIEHTKQQLFRPFRFGQWTRLAFVGLLAGELGSGGCNFHVPQNFPRTNPQQHFMPSGFPNVDPAILGAVIAVLVISGLVLGIFLLYVSSVMRFVLFDTVIAKECHIRQAWVRRQEPGIKYFWWKLLYMLAMILATVVLVGIPLAFAFALGWLRDPSHHILPLVLGGIVLFFIFLLFIVAATVVYVLTKDFVIPQMAFENIGAIEGWRRLWAMIDAEKGSYAGYIGMKIVMAIGAAIVIAIASVIVLLLIGIPVGALGLAAVLTGKTAGLTWNVQTITLAVVGGCVVLALFFYVISLISVPAIVFFPAYSIYFFAGRYPTLGAVMYPAPPAPAIPPSPAKPPEMPPLPPAAEPIG
jgi:hypothetical protein